VELRQALESMPDVQILYVVASRHLNPKALRFIDGNALREAVTFLHDPDGAAIDSLGLRRPGAEEMELGVPHPATYVLDRQGVVRLVDVREDYHIWLDPEPVLETLRAIGPS
jgi:peroxiredoxin